jgi:hypothetical protein
MINQGWGWARNVARMEDAYGVITSQRMRLYVARMGEMTNIKKKAHLGDLGIEDRMR